MIFLSYNEQFRIAQCTRQHLERLKLNFSESLNTIKQSLPDNTYYLLNCCSCVINYSSERSLIGFPEQEEVLPSRTPGPNVLFRNPLSFSFLFFLSPTRFDEFHFPFKIYLSTLFGLFLFPIFQFGFTTYIFDKFCHFVL